MRRVITFVAATLQSTCGGTVDCPSIGYGSPAILVIDAKTERAVCDATIIVRQSSNEAIGVRAPDVCDGLYPLERRPGFYAVEVSAPGYEPATTVLSISTDECGGPVVSPAGLQPARPEFAYTVTVELTAV